MRLFPIAWVTVRSQLGTLVGFLGITAVLLLLLALLPGFRLAVTVQAGYPPAVSRLLSLFAAFNALGVLLAIVLSSRTLPMELRNRTTHLLFTRPVSRWRFILEKWLGNVLVTLAGWALFLIAVTVTVVAMGAWEVLPRAWAASLVVALMMVTVSTLTTTLSLFLGGGLSLFVTGILCLIAVSSRGFVFYFDTTPHLLPLKWLCWALPPLPTLADLATRLLTGEPMLMTYVFGSLLYCYVALLVLMISFYRREV